MTRTESSIPGLWRVLGFVFGAAVVLPSIAALGASVIGVIGALI